MHNKISIATDQLPPTRVKFLQHASKLLKATMVFHHWLYLPFTHTLSLRTQITSACHLPGRYIVYQKMKGTVHSQGPLLNRGQATLFNEIHANTNVMRAGPCLIGSVSFPLFQNRHVYLVGTDKRLFNTQVTQVRTEFTQHDKPLVQHPKLRILLFVLYS